MARPNFKVDQVLQMRGTETHIISSGLVISQVTRESQVKDSSVRASCRDRRTQLIVLSDVDNKGIMIRREIRQGEDMQIKLDVPDNKFVKDIRACSHKGEMGQ